MKTTLNQIRNHSPCTEGWEKLLKHLAKNQADDEPLSIATIVASNGIEDALWCLRAVQGHDKEIRLYAVWCARQVQHLIFDKRLLDVLDVAERYAHGQASNAELSAARKAAEAVRDAAWAAAWAAVRNTAWAAVRKATEDVIWATARDAAEATAMAAAWDAARKSAWDAAMAAAMAAAGDVARDAAMAAGVAAARDAQEQELLRFCAEIDAAHGIKETTE